jgi:hypothetical protein
MPLSRVRTTPIAMEFRGYQKRRDHSSTYGGDIPEDTIDSGMGFFKFSLYMFGFFVIQNSTNSYYLIVKKFYLLGHSG